MSACRPLSPMPKRAFTWSESTPTPDRCAAVRPGRSYIEDFPRPNCSVCVEQDWLSAVVDVAGMRRRPRCRGHLRAHAARGHSRAGHLSDRGCRRGADLEPAARTARGADEHQLPGNDRRGAAPDSRTFGPRDRRGYLPGLRTRAHRPGEIRQFTLRNTPKVVGGVDCASTEIARQALSTIVDVVVPVRDATTAEMVKVLENTFRMVNIASPTRWRRSAAASASTSGR